jgi:hypothetical protein
MLIEMTACEQHEDMAVSIGCICNPEVKLAGGGGVWQPVTRDRYVGVWPA